VQAEGPQTLCPLCWQRFEHVHRLDGHVLLVRVEVVECRACVGSEQQVSVKIRIAQASSSGASPYTAATSQRPKKKKASVSSPRRTSCGSTRRLSFREQSCGLMKSRSKSPRRTTAYSASTTSAACRPNVSTKIGNMSAGCPSSARAVLEHGRNFSCRRSEGGN